MTGPFTQHDRVLSQNATLRSIYSQNNVEVVNCYPQTIQILPLLKCNYRCKMCFVSRKMLQNGPEIDWRVLKRLEPALPFAESIYLTGGEPLLYSRFDELTAMAARHGCRVSISTNGSLITERFESVANHVQDLKVSLDAATPETYKRIRIGGSFEKVVTSLLKITKWKIKNRSLTPRLRFSFVAMRSNVHELPELVELASEIGVEEVSAQYMSNRKGNEDLKKESLFYHQDYSDEWFLKAMRRAEELGVVFQCRGLFAKRKQQKRTTTFTGSGICTEPWRYMVVNPDGSIQPCCPGPMVMGNLNDQSFDDIWNNEKYRYLRRRINTADEPPECAKCTNCKIDMSKEDTFVGSA